MLIITHTIRGDHQAFLDGRRTNLTWIDLSIRQQRNNFHTAKLHAVDVEKHTHWTAICPPSDRCSRDCRHRILTANESQYGVDPPADHSDQVCQTAESAALPSQPLFLRRPRPLLPSPLLGRKIKSSFEIPADFRRIPIFLCGVL